MVKKVGKYNYDKAEATFKKEDELDKKLYAHLIKKSVIVGKSNYIKQLIYEDMIKDENWNSSLFFMIFLRNFMKF